MFERLSASITVAAAAALLTIPLLPQSAEAQDGARFRVLVPNLQPEEGAANRFGERVANNLRDLIDLPTHVAMDRRDIDRAAREYNMRLNDLGCLEARQLAALIDVPLVMCGTYSETGDQYDVNVVFYTVPEGEEFTVAPFQIAQRDERPAAERILGGFESLVQQVQYVAWCAQEYGSSNWEGALNYCTQAVDVAPDSHGARFALARTYMEMENFDVSLQHFEHLLDTDPYDDNVLQNAAWVAGQLGDTDKARDYYTRYLELNPGNTAVRIRVAFDLAQAGDSYGAMQFVQVGLQDNPDHVELLEAYGSYAFRAAVERQSMQPAGQDADQTLPPDIAELFREASETLMRVVEIEGSESRPQYVTNAIRAYLQLNEVDQAVRTAERGLQVFPEEANIWSEKSTAENRRGNVDQAVQDLERAVALNPDLPNARARMGNYMIAAGRIEDGARYLRQAVESGEQPADQMAAILFNQAYQNGIQENRDLAHGIQVIRLAKDLPVGEQWREQLDFWHGYALYQQGIQAQNPQTPESAQRSRPLFQEARQLFVASRGYADRTQGVNYDQLIAATDQYLEIQDAIIRRGGRR
jgi:tetratricopeptide (TPR) repeat protein